MTTKRILLAIIVFSLLLAMSVQAATYTVCSSGCDSTTIQGCIDSNASAGDTCEVGSASSYTERPVNVTKSVNIISNTSTLVSLTGGFNISNVDDVNISRFNVGAGYNIGANGFAISISNASNTNISSSVFSDVTTGASEWWISIDTSLNVVIENNTFNNLGSGLHVHGVDVQGNSDNTTIRSNIINGFTGALGTTVYGIRVWNSLALIEDNVVANCNLGETADRIAIHLKFTNTSNSIIRNNTVYNCKYLIGVESLITNISIVDNTLYDANNYTTFGGGDCIKLIDSVNDSIISDNNISDCTHAGIDVATSDSTNNLFYQNSVWNNTINAIDEGTNSTWNTTYPTGGNYWGDYNGLDNGSGVYPHSISGDGIGDDLPNYSISGSAGTYDYLPLVSDNPVITITPSSSVSVGTKTTTTCTASNTPLLTRNSITVSNPDISILPVGTYEYNCSVEGDYDQSFSTTSTLSVVEGGVIVGCSNSTTYAFRSSFAVTNNTTIMNFSSWIDDGKVRPDLRDHYVEHNDTWVNNSLIIINTTGDIGSTLNVYFGNYLNNNTINTSWSGSLVVTNSITNVSEINNYVHFTIMEEMLDIERKPPDADLVFNFLCAGGSSPMTILNETQVTRFLIATYSSWNETAAKVEYAPDDYYLRHYVHEGGVEYRQLWLVDAQLYSILEVVFDLDDLTGDFGGAKLTVQKWIGDNLRVVDEQYFDASGMAYFYGVSAERYSICLDNGDEVRCMGNIIVDANDLDKTITISHTDIGTIEYQGNITYSLTYNNVTGVITFYYFDPYSATNHVNFTVYNNTDGAQLYFASYDDIDEATFQYAVPNMDEMYRVKMELDHDPYIGQITWWGLVGLAGLLIVTGISALWLGFAALGGILLVALSTSPRNAPFGLVVTGFVTLMFVSLGWLPLPLTVVAFFMCLAVFWWFRAEAKKP